MKMVVALHDLLELDIRPEPLLAEYRARLERDIAARWGTGLRDVPCPGCGSAEATPAFARMTAQYRECARCGTLFVSPRPGEAAIIDFYRTGGAGRFWVEQVWPHTQSVRREKIVQPRAEWVLDGLAEYAPAARTGIDVSPYGGALAEELCADGDRTMVAASWIADPEPAAANGPVRVRSLSTGALANMGPVDYVTAFDLLDRVADLPAFVEALAGTVRPGGLLFATLPNADGFDLQVLWERAPSLVVPDKMNVLSIAGMMRRFGGTAWEVLELSTPGMFDVEQVRRVIEAEPDGAWPRVVRRLLARSASDADAASDLQAYLQRHRLASFARLVARRRG